MEEEETMRVSVEQKQLAKATDLITRVARSRIPSSGFARVATQGHDSLAVLCSDLVTTIEVVTPADVVVTGSVGVPAEWLAKIAKANVGEFELTTVNNTLTIRTGTNTEYSLRTVPLEDLPDVTLNVEPLAHFTVEKTVWDDAVKRVCVAASKDSARPALQGCLITVNNGIEFVATDSYRLAQVNINTKTTGEAKAVLDAPVLLHTTKIQSETITVSIGEDVTLIEAGNVSLRIRQIEGVFPDYKKVVPETFEHIISLSRTEFQEALKRVSALTRSAEPVEPVHLMFEDKILTMKVESAEIGYGEEQLHCDYTGELVQVAFNPRYLSDAVGNCSGDKLYIELNDPLHAVVFYGDGSYRHLVMPIRI